MNYIMFKFNGTLKRFCRNKNHINVFIFLRVILMFNFNGTSNITPLPVLLQGNGLVPVKRNFGTVTIFDINI